MMGLVSKNFCELVCICLLPLITIPQRVSSDEDIKDAFSTASCDFSADLLKTLSKFAEGNVVFSPTSVGILLAVLQQGARENTLQQLDTVLRMTAEQSKAGQSFALKSLQKEKVNVTLEWGNRAYIKPGFDVAEEFNSSIKENFGATIHEINFVEPSPSEAANEINNWIKDVTRGNIQDLVSPSSLTEDTTLILLNAIYFKGLWDVPFSTRFTAVDDFESSPNKTTKVSFMSQEDRFLAGEDLESGVKWVDLPFKDPQFSMLFILPTERHGLKQVLEKMNGSLLRKLIDDNNTRRVSVILPKFKLQEKISLGHPLQEMGLTEVFTSNANLEGITPNFNRLRLSSAIHKASVEIDETGSTASAATSFTLGLLSVPKLDDFLKFKADHPFVFLILDRENKVPLFAGIVADLS